MQDIPVRYQPLWGGLMLCAAVFILAVGLLLAEPIQLVVGTVNLLLGALFLGQPWIVVTSHEIQVRNLLGMTLKRHTYGSLAELSVVDGAIHKDGAKLLGKSFVARSDDWERVLAAVQGGR